MYDASSDSHGDPEEQREGLYYLVPPEFPTVLFGNKIDLLGNDKLQELRASEESRQTSHFIGSALTGENIEDAFQYLSRQIAIKKIRENEEEKDTKATKPGKGRITLRKESLGTFTPKSSMCKTS